MDHDWYTYGTFIPDSSKKNAGLTGPACNSVKHWSLLNDYLFGENGSTALVYYFHQVYSSLCIFR